MTAKPLPEIVTIRLARRDRSFAAIALTAISLLAIGCGGAASAEDARRESWEKSRAAAERAFLLGNYEEAVGHYEQAVTAQIVPEPGTPEAARAAAVRTVDFYNLACARALTGRTTAALDALEASLAGNDGVLRRDHPLDDPDLDSLKALPEFRRVAGPSPDVIEFLAVEGPGAGDGQSLAVVLSDQAGVFVDGGDSATADRVAKPVVASGWDVAEILPPWRSGKGTWQWRTRLDPGVEATRLARAAAEGRAGAVLVARGREAVATAWEILMRAPETFTAAVLDGPAPALPALLDREGGSALSAVRVYVVGESSRPAAARAGVNLPFAVEVVATLEEGLKAVRR